MNNFFIKGKYFFKQGKLENEKKNFTNKIKNVFTEPHKTEAKQKRSGVPIFEMLLEACQKAT